jgi:uncharacterized protein YlzI (FlbEa/FlbD family)
MIKVTTLDSNVIYINSTYIESITRHSQVDTIIRLHSGKTHIVTEAPEEVIQLIEARESECAI